MTKVEKTKSISIDTKVQTIDGFGIIEKITAPPFQFLVKLENGATCWTDLSQIIQIIE